MIRTIFRNTFLVGLSVLLLCGVLFFGMRYTQIQDETAVALRQEAVYAEQGVMMNGAAYLETLENTGRITWTDADGNVLYDSGSAQPAANQGGFAEIRAAMTDGEGQSVRKDGEGGESVLYYARKCEDGTILRLGRSQRAVQDALLAVSPVLWMLVLVILISGVLSFRAAKQIVKPINDLDLDSPYSNTYPELAPLIGKIQEQKLTIQEEVAQRETLRREFSANVSHELKTPLTSISGFAELMAEGVVEGSKVQEFSRDIYKESQRLMTLIDDIIKLSRLDEEAIGPEREQVDLYELSGEVLDSLKPAAEKQDVTLRLTGAPATVSGVYRLLNEMVYNLCDNAVKYNRPGGSVTVDVSGGEDEVRLSVADTGIGIPYEHQKRVFERFYRVDKSHSKEIGGTGLGLSIVKHGAQFHGAAVELSSEPGSGTTVTLRFPVNGALPKAAAPAGA
ncbi:MAG: two-component sensor histidine kinase [Lachnospiraceae bacterium]|nr:two-component sensor histidine kinase [Lachnospiraceae bacterium]